MADTIIGRATEREILRRCMDSGAPEFIAIYGRRRVGKTFLIRQFFNDAFSFYSTGIYQGTKREQLGAFCRQLKYYSGREWGIPKDWFEAFAQLKEKPFCQGFRVFLEFMGSIERPSETGSLWQRNYMDA